MSKSESSESARIGSKGALAVVLSGLASFQEPKVKSEQYTTDSEIAAQVLWNAKLIGDIGKVSVDLGCGTGILGIGLALLGSEKVLFVDSDEKALEIAKKNIEKVKSEGYAIGETIFMCKDISDFNEKCSLAIQNPPFGTKVSHADKKFLKKAFEASDIIYSFHKSEGKKFVEKFSTENNFTVTHVWDFNFPLKATYNYHRRKIKRIDVSCFRIEKQKLFK